MLRGFRFSADALGGRNFQMTTSDPRLSGKPWLAPNAGVGSYALGLLGLEERKLLYELARDVYTGRGAIVELGAFCGASTCCLAAGLRDNPRRAGQQIHSYDQFTADEPYLVDFVRAKFGQTIELGQSFYPIFRRATQQFARLVEVHTGNLLEQAWSLDAPIEILFVDIAKTLALSGKVLTEFFKHLEPQMSLVIHQDFYHPTAFYLPVIMDFLSDHFTIIEAGRDWSVVFRLDSAIPDKELETASLYKFSFVQQRAALRRMMRRVGTPGSDYLRLSECAAIGTSFGERRFHAAVASAVRHSKLENDRVWNDGLDWCRNFRASNIRTRLYGSPSLAPAPRMIDKAYLSMFTIYSEIFERIAESLPKHDSQHEV